MPAFPERQPNESTRAYRAFCDYAAAGAARTLREVLAAYIKQQTNNDPTQKPPTDKWNTLATWSLRHSWVDRAKRYDAACAAERAADLRHAHRAEVEALRLQAREDAKTRRAIGRGLLVKVAERLRTLQVEDIEPQHLASLVNAAGKELSGALDQDAAALGIDEILLFLDTHATDLHATE